MEELNKEKAVQNLGENASVATSPLVSLDGAISVLSKNEPDTEKRKTKIEKQLLQNEQAGKERGEVAKAEMRANTDRAKQTADKVAAIVEYSEEYQRRLFKEEERRERAARLQRERERLSEEKEKSEARQSEIEEFMRRESSLSEEREKRSSEMLARLNSLYEKKTLHSDENIEKSEEDTEKVDTPAVISEENVSTDTHINDTPLAEDIQEKEENTGDELVLRIGYGEKKESSDDMTITIGAIALTPEIINEEIKIAEKRHSELCRDAIASAHGDLQSEKRLLEKEDERYRAEIAELRARLEELSVGERRYGSPMQTFVSTIPLYSTLGEGAFGYDDFASLGVGEELERAGRIDDKFSETYLESELINSFDKYQEKNTRVGKNASSEYSDAFLYSEGNGKRDSGSPEYNERYLEEEYLKQYSDAYHSEKAEMSSDRYSAAGNNLYPSDSVTPRYLEERYEYYTDADPAYVPQAALGQTPTNVNIEKKEELTRLNSDDGISHYHTEELSLFKKAELISRLDAFNKQEKLALKKISKIEASQKKAEHEENIALIVEKIGVQKEICELSIEALSSAAYADVRGRITKHKRILEEHIDRYNLFCDEYETATGRPLERLSKNMASDVISGKICKPIPNVYYSGAEGDTAYGALDARSDKAHRLQAEEQMLYQEYNRYLEDGARAEFLPDGDKPRQKSDKNSQIRYKTERDILLIGLRNEYVLSSLEAKKDILTHSFGSDIKKLKELDRLEKRIEKAKKATLSSLKLERSDNARFYMLPLLDPIDEKPKRSARPERLNALRVRLNALLSEREDINERLITLYGGADKKLARVEVNRKAGVVRRKSAKAMRRRQHQLARIINKYKAPVSMKEEAYGLLNRKIALVALADETRYKLKRLKPFGNARRELVRTLRKTERDIRHNDKEIRYMIKRIKGYETRFEEHKGRAKLLIATVLILAALISSVLLFGDDVAAYFTDLIAKFGA